MSIVTPQKQFSNVQDFCRKHIFFSPVVFIFNCLQETILYSLDQFLTRLMFLFSILFLIKSLKSLHKSGVFFN